MSRVDSRIVLLAALLAAGCASAPEQAAESPGLSGAQNAPQAASASNNGVMPNRIVDVTEQPPASSTVRCREMLKQGSNVIIRRCMTIADWERFERHQAQDAREIVRMLQGSAYR